MEQGFLKKVGGNAVLDAVAGVTPANLGAEAAGGTVRISSVMDLASETYRLIDGLNEFRIAGIDLTVPDGEDESLALVAADGATKVSDITVVSTEDGQRIVCTLASAVSKGTYYVRLVSHGLDPTSPLTTVLHKVSVKEAAPPPAPESEGQSSDGTVKVMSLVDTDESATMLTAGHQWDVTGEGLNIDSAAGNEWMISGVAIEGDGISADLSIVEGSADKTYLSLRCGDDVAAPGDYEIGVKFTLVRNEGQDHDDFVIIKMLHVPQGA